MKALVGLVMLAIGDPVGWWAFNQAVAGRDSYNWSSALVRGRV